MLLRKVIRFLAHRYGIYKINDELAILFDEKMKRETDPEKARSMDKLAEAYDNINFGILTAPSAWDKNISIFAFDNRRTAR